jgi:hypothetical protein
LGGTSQDLLEFIGLGKVLDSSGKSVLQRLRGNMGSLQGR